MNTYSMELSKENTTQFETFIQDAKKITSENNLEKIHIKKVIKFENNQKIIEKAINELNILISLTEYIDKAIEEMNNKQSKS